MFVSIVNCRTFRIYFFFCYSFDDWKKKMKYVQILGTVTRKLFACFGFPFHAFLSGEVTTVWNFELESRENSFRQNYRRAWDAMPLWRVTARRNNVASMMVSPQCRTMTRAPSFYSLLYFSNSYTFPVPSFVNTIIIYARFSFFFRFVPLFCLRETCNAPLVSRLSNACYDEPEWCGHRLWMWRQKKKKRWRVRMQNWCH